MTDLQRTLVEFRNKFGSEPSGEMLSDGGTKLTVIDRETKKPLAEFNFDADGKQTSARMIAE